VILIALHWLFTYLAASAKRRLPVVVIETYL